MEGKIISLAEAGRSYFNVTPETAREYVRKGKIPAFKVGKNWLVNVKDMDQRYRELATGPAAKDREIADLVRTHIHDIEVALLVMSNTNPESRALSTTTTGAEIAELADKLAWLCRVEK